VPNSHLLKVTARYPDLFVPCASIKPKRKDAHDELDRCAEGGARVVKIHPPTMDVDPADPRFRKFFGRCADKRMMVMVHTGTEHSADTVGDEFGDPRRLSQALEEGCTVIAAHAGMNAFFDRMDFSMNLRPMIRRFRNLYFDTAVLASMFRWRNLPKLMEDSELLERAIHGSDFPFPSNALVFWNRIAPSNLARLISEKNLFERDYRLKLALGMPAAVFERAALLLADPRRPVADS
jgi:predicted TIM-barrel fold metal-dependent hydrolase